MYTKNTKESAKSTKKDGKFDPLSGRAIGCALEVHRALGPGLLESAYEQCLVHELKIAGMHVQRQVPISIVYKGLAVECGYRLDLLVEDTLVLELKTVDRLMPTHEAQLLTYMRLAEKAAGLLINFHSRFLRDGIKRYVL
ncbi:MAG: GxxExxY protein [Candidatus Wenzhouxiangella sp. M2_3B_020]